MDIGLDVGTGTTKLAWYRGDARPASGVAVVPTAISFHGLVSQIPGYFADDQPPADEVRCDGFPAMLGARPPEHVTAWGGRTSAEVTQSFLRRLLDQDSVKEERLVVTVPPAVGDPAAGARDAGTELVEILRALGHHPQRMLPAPIAALAYLRRKDPGLAAATRFLVCDIGAGGMSFALCTAAASGVRVADVARLSGTAAWGSDTVAAGLVAGGRPVTLVEGLVAEIAAVSGASAADPSDRRLVDRWRALEAALADPVAGDSAGWELRRLFGGGRRYPGSGSVRFADIEVTATQLLGACTPLADAAGAALAGLLARQADPSWRHFGPAAATRIVLIGGLAGLQPVRAALLRVAGLDPDDPGTAAVEAGSPGAAGPDFPPADTAGDDASRATDRLGAAALGAALVAMGQAEPSVRYPHALRLPVHRQVRGRIETSYLELAAAGTITAGQTEMPVNGTDGAPIVITVPASRGPVSLTAPLPVQVVPGDGAQPVPAEFDPAPPPPAGDYRLTVSGDPAGVAIVLRGDKTGQALRYVLRQPADPTDETG